MNSFRHQLTTCKYTHLYAAVVNDQIKFNKLVFLLYSAAVFFLSFKFVFAVHFTYIFILSQSMMAFRRFSSVLFYLICFQRLGSDIMQMDYYGMSTLVWRRRTKNSFLQISFRLHESDPQNWKSFTESLSLCTFRSTYTNYRQSPRFVY